MDWLWSEPWLGVAVIAVGCVMGAAAIFVFLRSRRVRIRSFSVATGTAVVVASTGLALLWGILTGTSELRSPLEWPGQVAIPVSTVDSAPSSGWVDLASNYATEIVYLNVSSMPPRDFDPTGLEVLIDRAKATDARLTISSPLEFSHPAVSIVGAQAVKDYIVEAGVPADRVLVINPAEQPIAPPPAADTVRVVVEPPAAKLAYAWNSWTYPKGEDWRSAVGELEPNTPYGVVIDLAALEYGTPNLIDSRRVHKSFFGYVEAQAARQLPTLTMEVIVVTDGRLHAVSRAPLKLEIDLRKVRENHPDRLTLPASVLESFRQDPHPSWMFGRLLFEVATGAEKGWTSFALSFWHEGRPFDELVFSRCVGRIGEDCDPAKRPLGPTLGGGELFEVMGDTTSNRPNAAIHLIELSDDRLVGVFARNDPERRASLEDYRVWTIDLGANAFNQRLLEVEDTFARATDAPIRIGEAFTNLVFPPRKTDADSAHEALRAFLSGFPSDPFAADRPILFVRMLGNRGRTTPLYPIALLNMAGNEKDFLGYRARIYSPLAEQRYGRSACPQEWRTLAPRNTTDDALKSARAFLARRMVGTAALKMKVGNSAVPIFRDIKEFSQFIGPARASTNYVLGLPATLLTTLSHHSDNSLFFNEKDPIDAANITASFRGDSIAILAGCTTGRPGPGGFVYELNQAGFRSIIATSTGIGGDLAGCFVNKVAEALESARDTPTIGELFDQTQKSLHDSGIFGPSLLSFVLVGNPDAEVCLPN